VPERVAICTIDERWVAFPKSQPFGSIDEILKVVWWRIFKGKPAKYS
jgi:hypothetical protein